MVHRALVLACFLFSLFAGRAFAEPILAPGFTQTTVLSGLTFPTVMRFAPDGRVFVGEKSGRIRVYRGLDDQSPMVISVLEDNVMDYWDRGLLGLAVDPGFPARPYIYVLYSYDAPPGETAPYWHDSCADATRKTCPITGRLSRLEIGPDDDVVGGEHTLLADEFCQQFPSHSIGTAGFGPDGALYVSAGEGAWFGAVDYGQLGDPVNPCGDPANEGGAFRAQDLLLTDQDDPLGYNGVLLRVDPSTGAALPDSPLAGDPRAGRIVALGLRNPFRFTFRQGTSEVWVGDVGMRDYEEIDRIIDPLDANVENFGWPCWEGPDAQALYMNQGICESLYEGELGATTPPYYTYPHKRPSEAEECEEGGQLPAGGAISGLAFYLGEAYPPELAGALFIADYAKGCIWAMPLDADGLPDTGGRRTIVAGASSPVQLEIGPGGDVYYVGFYEGTIERIQYFPVDRPPRAVIEADPTNGQAPLIVHFSAAASSDPDPGDVLSYEWDLDGDGDFDDSTDPAPSYEYLQAAEVVVGLRVRDPAGATALASELITVGNAAPKATIVAPTPALAWQIGDDIVYRGAGSDPEDGELPGSAFAWTLVLHHCASPTSCHAHVIQTTTGAASGVVRAPEHELPSYLELRLQVTDSGGLSDEVSVELMPRTVDLTFTSEPAGLALAVDQTEQATPYTTTMIVGGRMTVSAPAGTLAGVSYAFVRWSDSGSGTHVLEVPASPATYTAIYGVDADGDGSADPPRPAEPGACGCRVAGGRPSGWLLLGFLAFRRRRRRP